jgi:predicted amidophosphoribosyltransferase
LELIVALCLNPQCQKRVPSASSTCSFCGGAEISEFNSYTKSESLKDELSMENFHRVAKYSEPLIEMTIFNDGAKASFSSRLIVRLQFITRKAFRRR